MDVSSAEELRRLSYVELKQYAKQQGIKANMKAEKLVAALLAVCEKERSQVVLDEGASSFFHENELNIAASGSVSARITRRRTTQVLSAGNTPIKNGAPSEAKVKEEKGNKSVKKSKRTAVATAVERPPNESVVTNETKENPNTSKRRSRRIGQILFMEKSPEANSSMSDDSEIELKMPTSYLKREGTFCVENPVTPMTSNKTVSLTQITVTPAKTPRKSILRNTTLNGTGQKYPLPSDSRGQKSIGNKVNFITPDKKVLVRSNSSSEVQLKSVKDRPKTPVAARVSVKRKRSESSSEGKSLKMIKNGRGEATPKSSGVQFQESKVSLSVGKKSDNALQTDTPMPSVELKPVVRNITTRVRAGRNGGITPSKSVKKDGAVEPTKFQTPNFREIHEKAFEKMENLQEYQERKKKLFHTLTKSQRKARAGTPSSVTKRPEQNGQDRSSKKDAPPKSQPIAIVKPSCIPRPFRGMPFIPTVKSIRKINTNFTGDSANTEKKCQRNLFTSGLESTVFQFGKENISQVVTGTNQKSRRKFDLKASLAKKLPYKPHRGALKPLANSNETQVNTPFLDPIKVKRAQSREVLKGVRKNRRFELQMCRRGLA